MCGNSTCRLANCCYVAVRYITRLAAFEEILDEGAKMSIGIKRHLFSAFIWKTGLPDASEMATPKRVRASVHNSFFSRMDNRKIKMDNKKSLAYTLNLVGYQKRLCLQFYNTVLRLVWRFVQQCPPKLSRGFCTFASNFALAPATKH